MKGPKGGGGEKSRDWDGEQQAVEVYVWRVCAFLVLRHAASGSDGQTYNPSLSLSLADGPGGSLEKHGRLYTR